MPQRASRPSAVPVRRTGVRRSAALRRSHRLITGALVAVVAAAVVAADGGSALADPVNPSDQQLDDARSAQDAAAAEVGRIAGLVAAAEAELEQAQVRAEAAGTAYLAAEEARQAAEQAAAQAALDLQVAADAVAAAEVRVAELSRNSYMNGSDLTSEMVLLDVEGPAELMRKAAMLDYVADHQTDVLGELEAAQLQQEQADATARAARDQKVATEAAAAAAKAEAEAQLANQQQALADFTAQKASLDEQLQAAQVRLLELQGARDAYQAWVAQKAAEEAAAREAEERARSQAAEDESADSAAAGYARPASGRTSSCFGSRWGVTHYGVDIAAPIGRPVHAATSGVVQRAGAATGFGLAVYIRGDDGAVTVYGHVNSFDVVVGERVAAGQRIGEVGNRGQSTGPHLHFEVHPSGALYGGQVDPVPWLRARGISLRGCG